MIEKRVAKCWGQALFSIAKEQDKVEQWYEELSAVCTVLHDNPQFEQLLTGRMINGKVKRQMIQEFFGSRLSSPVLEMLFLLIDKNREDYVPAISQAYKDLIDESTGVLPAEVVTASAPTAAEEERLRQALCQIFKRDVRLHFTVDKNLIGGITVKVNDLVYDGSIRRQLDKLEEELRK